MKLIFRSLLFIITVSFLTHDIKAQEVLVPLSGNPDVKEYYGKLQHAKKAVDADTVELPFIDDFSNSNIVPKRGLWVDFNAYVNNRYPVFPVSAGVATLDALKYDGSHYANAGTSPYIADFLTSNPIALDYPASDSIYLSFFYQPEGKGEMPDTQDSLCLDFFDPGLEVWNRIWAVPGTALHPFRRVMIPLTDERYLKDGFRFRFFNYASQTKNNDYYDKRANVDHWHLDYIQLHRFRSISDTVLRDVCFVDPLTSLLKNYSSIPWEHFPEAYAKERKTFIKVALANHDTIKRNVTRYLEIKDLTTSFVYRPTPTASDIPATDSIHFLYPYDYPFEFGSGDSSKYLIKTYIRTDAFDYKPNDTLTYTQLFKNYYAYDDGSAEVGYGIRGSNSQNASVAVRFNSYQADSLRAVDMYFNQVMDSVNLNFYFYLKVWEDNNGVPGNLIYSKLGVKPEYTSPLNNFHRYELDSALFMNGPFFIGWTKTTDKMLNVGWDVNRNSGNNIFYNLGGEWQNTKFPGSLMLRAVMDTEPLGTGISDDVFKETENILKVYPNPADSYIRFEINGNDPYDYNMYIMDVTGRKVAIIDPSYEQQLNTSGLKNGMYFIYLINNTNGKQYSHKILIHH